MRIEKIRDKQIRCTLTQADLQNHHINIGELAYGSEKARSLFQEMLSQASREFNFHAENMPLMIEAVPMSGDNLVLVITKVEDPDEIDTRFSKFSPYKENSPAEPLQLDGADNIIDIFQKICEAKMKGGSSRKQATTQKDSQESSASSSDTPAVNLTRLFCFNKLDDVIAAAHGLNSFFTGLNTLYKEGNEARYQLVIHQSGYSPEKFNKVCNILSEYGKSRPFSIAGEAHLKEHGELISKNALQQLTQL